MKGEAPNRHFFSVDFAICGFDFGFWHLGLSSVINIFVGFRFIFLIVLQMRDKQKITFSECYIFIERLIFRISWGNCKLQKIIEAIPHRVTHML